MTETHDLRNQWYDEPVQYENPMTEKEQIQNQIQELQEKLKKLEELSQTKSPVEEAYKRIYGNYPDTGIGTGFSYVYWDVFQKAYEQAQKDYKVGEHQETSQELKTLYQMLDGKYCPDACVIICDIVKEWMYQYDCDYVMCREYLEGYEECQTVLEERLK